MSGQFTSLYIVLLRYKHSTTAGILLLYKQDININVIEY